jgi:hypothetical protein
MGIRRISARRNPKTGRIRITFEVDPETWANMERSAKADAHPGTLDYVAARINMAFIDDEPQGEPGKSDMDDGLPW